ncbi:MAG: hypothetical protein LAO21_04885 [Acidobacteriia bacterium]|nr:hypothetical protein [Terriglobia bacterium]
MISCRLALCAESVVKDADTNSISVFNIFEEMVPSGFPFALPKMNCLFFTEFHGEQGQIVPASLRITWGETELFKRPIQIDFRENFTSRLIFHFHGMPIQGPGTVRVALIHEDQDIGGWSFEIREAPQPEAETKEP